MGIGWVDACFAMQFSYRCMTEEENCTLDGRNQEGGHRPLTCLHNAVSLGFNAKARPPPRMYRLNN